MSVTAVHDPATPTRRGRRSAAGRTRHRDTHLRPVPGHPSTSVLLAISVDLADSQEREAFIRALTDLVGAGGPQTSIAMQAPNPGAAPTFVLGGAAGPIGGPGGPVDGPAGPPSGRANGSAEPAHSGRPSVDIHPGPREVRSHGRQLQLSRLEFDLLLFLAERPRQVFSRTQLLNQVWQSPHVGIRTVDVHVRRLRAKLGHGVPVITTVYGVGYRIADEVDVRIHPR